jgi:outer membrane protein
MMVSGLLPSASVLAADVSPLVQLSDEQGMMRLQLSVPTGALEQSQLTAKGKQLVIVLRDQNRDEWSAIAKQIAHSGQGVKNAKLVEQQGRLLLVVDLLKAMTVADETLVLGSSGKRSQWELVMVAAPVSETVAPVVIAPPALQVSDLDVQDINGVQRLTLRGDAALTAEVAFPDKGNGILLAFPGVNANDLAALVGESVSLKQFGRASVGLDAQGITQLFIETDRPLDLLDATGRIENKQSVTQLDLVFDAQASSTVAAVNRLAVDEKTGQLQVFGAQQAQVQTYFLDSPRRLMVDLLGVPPEGVEKAVAQFKAGQGGIKSVRYGDTRLGSARLEITPDVALAERLTMAGVVQSSGDPVALVAMNPVAPSTMVLQETVTKTEGGLSAGEMAAGAAVAVLAAPVVAVAAVVAAMSGDEQKPTIPAAQTEPEKDAVALPTVQAEPTPSEVAAMAGLDLRYRPKFDFAQQPRITIKPISLATEKYKPEENLPNLPQGKGYALMSLFDTAITQDSAYQAAKADYMVNAEAIPQAKSGYLPQASFDYSYATTRQNVNQSGSIPTGGYEYPYNNWAVTITQPIFRMQSLIKMDQAEVAVEQAKLGLLAAEQDLILRVANAYLGVLAAKDALELVRAEREATEKQLDLASTRFKNGLGTVTQLSEAQSRVALVKAREIDADYKLSDARLSMKQIIGDEVADVTTFREDFSPAAPVPAIPEPWVKAALDQNLALQTRKLAIDIANQEVKRQNAAYMPTVDAVASAGQRDTARTLYSPSREQVDTNYDITLKLRMPLYDGGMTPSLVRESIARLDKTKQEHQQEYRQTEKLVRSSFMGVKTSSEMLTALREGVKAQELTLKSKVEGYKAGVESVVSVLDSYRSYYLSRRDYLQARYDYLVNRLKLKQSVGTLSRNDLVELAELLH